MANYNKIIMVGNLTRDPQLSFLPSNTPVCEFGLAVNRTWKSSDGEKRESTCFIDCRLFGKSAETFNQYMTKGRPVLIEGRLEFDTWEKDGQRRSKHRVFVENFQFLGGKDDAKPAAQPAAAPEHRVLAEDEPGPADDPTGSNIPF